MRIKKVDPELYFLIRNAWMLEERQREDSLRSLDQMEHNLLEDPNTYWYFGPSERSFFWIDDVVPEDRARFHSVNADGRDGFNNRKAAMKIIKDIMADLDVRRLEALVPASSKVIKSLLWHLGFTHEGTLRRRLLYDGTWVDAEIYSLLVEELERKIKARKRRVRKTARPDVEIADDTSEGGEEEG